MKANKPIVLFLAILLCCACLSTIKFAIVEATDVTTMVTTELINYFSFTTTEENLWISRCQTQNITMFIARLPSMYFNSIPEPDSQIADTKRLIIKANAVGIEVAIDMHTWSSTWDNYFDDNVGNHEQYRANYITHVLYVISAFEDDGAFTGDVTHYMVMNEPQVQSNPSDDEDAFILAVVNAANAETAKPISVRWMGGHSPTTGEYAASIDAASDFICRNTYWDARYPAVEVWQCSEADLLTARDYAHTNSKEYWITEFGRRYNNPDNEEQRDMVESFVTWSIASNIDRVFCWVSAPDTIPTDELYNIFTGTSSYTPRPAWYELISETGEAPPAGTNTVTLNAPNDLENFEVLTIKFNFTAVFHQAILNASLYLNLTGTWQNAEHDHTIANNTMETLSHTFSVEAIYKWNIKVFNSTHAVWATANRTLTIDTTPPENTPPEYLEYTVNRHEADRYSTFTCRWIDDDFLSYGFMSHNNSGTWTNRTALGLFAPYDIFIDGFTLNAAIGTVIGYKFYANDTDNAWSQTEIFTLTTIAIYYDGGSTWGSWWG